MSDTKTHPLMYVALKRMKVGDGYREPGDEVPEAAGWRNIQAYVNRSMIQVVPRLGADTAGGVDFRSQAGRTESSRPVHKPVHNTQGTQATNEISQAATFDKLTAAQISTGLREGSLYPSDVEAYELTRDKPRKGVLRDLGWEDHEIDQGYRDENAPEESTDAPEDQPYEEWTEEELADEWYRRHGEDNTPPDDREGLIADLKADDDSA